MVKILKDKQKYLLNTKYVKTIKREEIESLRCVMITKGKSLQFDFHVVMTLQEKWQIMTIDIYKYATAWLYRLSWINSYHSDQSKQIHEREENKDRIR